MTDQADPKIVTIPRRPQLPSGFDELDAVLWQEIERVSDGLSPRQIPQAVATAILAGYEISPELQRYLMKLGLTQLAAELLTPEEDDEDEDC